MSLSDPTFENSTTLARCRHPEASKVFSKRLYNQLVQLHNLNGWYLKLFSDWILLNWLFRALSLGHSLADADSMFLIGVFVNRFLSLPRFSLITQPYMLSMNLWKVFLNFFPWMTLEIAQNETRVFPWFF